MPILNDIMDHKVLGREFKRGLHEGELIGELAILRRLLEKRFGPMPAWAEQSLAARSKEELEELSVRILDAPTIEDLLK